MQIASVMGMSVSVDLLQTTYPIPATSEALEGDLVQLEKANFLRPTDVPGTWHMTQATPCCRGPIKDGQSESHHMHHAHMHSGACLCTRYKLNRTRRGRYHPRPPARSLPAVRLNCLGAEHALPAPRRTAVHLGKHCGCPLCRCLRETWPMS